jgi:hypothetical protein
MAKSRERGTGSVYLRDDPKSPGQKLQTYWISYYVDGKRKRESAGTRKKSEAQALLKRRMGEHALGVEIGDEEKRLTFEDLEAGFQRSYENSGRRSLRRAGNAWDRLREHFGSWRARAITANALESYAADRLKEAAPATVQYELAVLRRAMSLAVKKGQLRSRPHFPHVGVHNARTGFFTREEMEKIATEIGPELGNLVRVAPLPHLLQQPPSPQPIERPNPPTKPTAPPSHCLALPNHSPVASRYLPRLRLYRATGPLLPRDRSMATALRRESRSPLGR